MTVQKTKDQIKSASSNKLSRTLKLPPCVDSSVWKLSQQMFREMIKRAVDYKQNPSDFMDEVMQELEVHLSEYQNTAWSLMGSSF